MNNKNREVYSKAKLIYIRLSYAVLFILFIYLFINGYIDNKALSRCNKETKAIIVDIKKHRKSFDQAKINYYFENKKYVNWVYLDKDNYYSILDTAVIKCACEDFYNCDPQRFIKLNK